MASPIAGKQEEEEEEEEVEDWITAGRSEIEEEEEEEENSRDLFEIKHQDESSLFSYEFGDVGDNHVVYVAVSKTNYDESIDALSWTLNNIPNTLVYLIHVFPEFRYLPTPLGKLPISRANPEQKETFMIQERLKTRDYLQNFLHLCSTSKVRVETILIQSDMEAKAILDLIPILYVKTLVLGASKSTLRKMSTKKGNAIVDQILHNAPDFCKVKIICQGKQVTQEQLMVQSPTPSPRSTPTSPKVQDHINDTFACCFKPKAQS